MVGAAPDHGRDVVEMLRGRAADSARPAGHVRITAAKQWRADAIAALRAGTMTTGRGPTLADAVDAWLTAMRARHVRTSSSTA